MPVSELSADRMVKANWALAGTVSDIRRQMDALIEAGNPEWFVWQSEQGVLPLDEVKRLVRTVGEEVLPHYL